MKTAVIVQARMTSTRLPGKVLKPILQKPMLAYELERLQDCRCADVLVVATTTNGTDDPVVDLCREMGIPFFRGSEDDVLSRYLGAALQEQAELVVRVTADCPLIDPEVIDRVIKAWTPAHEYVSNIFQRSFPRGLDTEVFSAEVLKRLDQDAQLPSEREHVTSYIYNNPGLFRILTIESGHRGIEHHRWTVDTPEDFELVQRIIEDLYPKKADFRLNDVLELLEGHPDWVALNQHIEQKK